MVRSYIRFIDRLVSRGNKKLKIILFYCVAEEAEDKYKVFKEAEKFLSTDNTKLLSSNRKAHRETLSFIFHLMIEFWQYTNYKIFMDPVWKTMWEITYELSDFFKNLCENKSTYFKRFFSEFKPGIQNNLTVNKRKWTIFFTVYVRAESLNNNGLVYINKENRLTIKDRPEVLYSKKRYQELVAEFMTGPCPANQRQIYIYRPDFWHGIMLREMDDVNSDFLDFKESVIDYNHALMEGEGHTEIEDETIQKHGKDAYLVTNFLASNYKPEEIYNFCFRMLKRLYVYNKFVRSPGYRRSILAKVAAKQDKVLKIYK